MKTDIYQVQSFFTMDEYPNYEETWNKGYFLCDVNPFRLFNKITKVNNIKIKRTPFNYDEISPGFYQVAVNLSKVQVNDDIIEEVTPVAISFVDPLIISAYDNGCGNKKMLYLSNLVTEFSDKDALITFLSDNRDELCLDFYDLLDILITYDKISSNDVSFFFTTS